MRNYEAYSTILRIINSLRVAGSWCGETHVQKAAYFLKEMCRVPLDYDFVLYKHGPYSFDLSNELGAIYADGLISLENQDRYGPKINVSPRGERLIAGTDLPDDIQKSINFICERFGSHGVADLERFATALFIQNSADGELDASVEKKAEALTQLKPHVKKTDALGAVIEVEKWIREIPSRTMCTERVIT